MILNKDFSERYKKASLLVRMTLPLFLLAGAVADLPYIVFFFSVYSFKKLQNEIKFVLTGYEFAGAAEDWYKNYKRLKQSEAEDLGLALLGLVVAWLLFAVAAGISYGIIRSLFF